MATRWQEKGPDARRRAEAYQPKDTLRPDNAADGPFSCHPSGAVLFASPRRRSSSPYLLADTTRRPSLMRGENHGVVWPLGFQTEPSAIASCGLFTFTSLSK